jgi:hypothetical protein
MQALAEHQARRRRGGTQIAVVVGEFALSKAARRPKEMTRPSARTDLVSQLRLVLRNRPVSHHPGGIPQ